MIRTTSDLRTLHIGAVIFLGLAVTIPLRSQVAKPGYDDRLLFKGAAGAVIGGTVQQWTLNDTGTFFQFSAPFSVSVPVGNRMLLSVTNSGMSSSSDRADVAGIVDTRVGLSYVLPGDRIWLTAGASIPTGTTELDEANGELDLSKYITQPAFAFRTPVFGQGFSGNAGVAYAAPLTRRLVFGLGTSFFYRGEYRPVKSSGDSGAVAFDYDPGDEVSVNMGIDYITYSKAARVSFDLTATYFFDDRLNGATVFRSGPRFSLFGVYALRTGEFSHALNARLRYRLQNAYITAGTETKYDAAVQGEAQYTLTRPLTDWLVGTGSVELKYYTPDQVPFGGSIVKTGDATVVSIGADLLLLVSDIVTPTVTLRYAAGTSTIADGAFNEVSYDVTGLEAGVGLKVSF